MKILVGTDKGLVEYDLVNNELQLAEIHFMGLPVGAVCHDTRSGWIWVGVNHKHWGPKIHCSKDKGKNWDELSSLKFPGGKEVVKSIWTIDYGPTDNPETLYIGIEPAALFKTSDGGITYQLIESLWDHPTKSLWTGGGKGSMYPFLHSAIVDPSDNSHIYVGISCAGVFETKDDGTSWEPINNGLTADYLPDPKALVGHDPHCLKMSSTNNKVIWQQNHCGIYKTYDGGREWKNVKEENGIANYGFAMALDPEDDDRVWVIPSLSDDLRIPINQALVVCETLNGGESWKELKSGLPQSGVFDLVLRQGLDISGSHLVFGTNNGNLYHSADYGETWIPVSQNLATIRVVKFVQF